MTQIETILILEHLRNRLLSDRRPIQGNDKLPDCEKFYQGYNAGINRYAMVIEEEFQTLLGESHE